MNLVRGLTHVRERQARVDPQLVDHAHAAFFLGDAQGLLPVGFREDVAADFKCCAKRPYFQDIWKTQWVSEPGQLDFRFCEMGIPDQLRRRRRFLALLVGGYFLGW